MTRENDPIDEEDVMECKCYIVFCISNQSKFYFDRVYRSLNLAQKRVAFLQAVSGSRGRWAFTNSELGK